MPCGMLFPMLHKLAHKPLSSDAVDRYPMIGSRTSRFHVMGRRYTIRNSYIRFEHAINIEEKASMQHVQYKLNLLLVFDHCTLPLKFASSTEICSSYSRI